MRSNARYLFGTVVLVGGLVGCEGGGFEEESSRWDASRPAPRDEPPVFRVDAGHPGFFDAGFFEPGPPPALGPVVIREDAPPPISGGTLLALSNGTRLVASDPDRDAVYVVTLEGRVVQTIALQPHDEPGRLVEDADGRVHVALRRGGALLTINPETASVISRRAACAAPRGVAYDTNGDRVWLACAGGELMAFPAAGGESTVQYQLEQDLRDVVVLTDKLIVSIFRTAEVLHVTREGAVLLRERPAPLQVEQPSPDGAPINFIPSVAWRMVPNANGTGVVMVHQRALQSPVHLEQGGYGSSPNPCRSGIVEVTVSVLAAGAPQSPSATLAMAVLPVDLALSPNGFQVAVATPGNAVNGGMQVTRALLGTLVNPGQGECSFGDGQGSATPGEVIALAYTPNGQLVAQVREPAELVLWDTRERITLSTESRAHTGHTLFHMNAGAFISCASCHPEGGDDALTWTFAGLGPRRTQTFRGGLSGTEPLHWNGEFNSLQDLVHEVFGRRMGGGGMTSEQVVALGHWMDRIPELPVAAPEDPQAVLRGEALFFDETVACASCHSGEHLTNNLTVDVGTGGIFQVPMLRGIRWRAPFMHDGCAPSLRARFIDQACSGGDLHGQTSHLSAAQVDDLVAYLQTL